jgi:hydroxymethylpyrimidine pyrophosphatase-like HAD family hydrolase
MRYHALACDYDGTLAHDGRLDPSTVASLRRLRASGRRLLMVTGRQIEDLLAVCPEIDLFDLVVGENGALVYVPSTGVSRELAEAPPPRFVEALRARGVAPISVGRVIVATWYPHETVVLEVIRSLGLELQVIFNKGAVMILPSGVNKATGLQAALAELELSPHNVVGVGDAENDHAFLSTCECAVAVANALPTLKERADLVTSHDHGQGVSELIDALLATDLREVAPRLARHDIPLGTDAAGAPVRMPAYGVSVLVAGAPGGNTASITGGIVERLAERRYQFALIDPEGDQPDREGLVTLGKPDHPPAPIDVVELLEKPEENAAVNLVGLALPERPQFLAKLFPRLQELRARVGRPHWIVLDEVDQLWPASRPPVALSAGQDLPGLISITVRPELVSPALLSAMDLIIAVGSSPDQTVRGLAAALGEAPPVLPETPLEAGDAILWWRKRGQPPVWLRGTPPRRERRRHQRRYMERELGPERSFYFRGPDGRLNLRAQNLLLFLQMADGIDDGTWLFHLRQGDYSRWLRDAVNDSALADEVAAIERSPDPPPPESRAHVRAAIERRYTAPA